MTLGLAGDNGFIPQDSELFIGSKQAQAAL